MGIVDSESQVREISIEAVITRADGTVEDLGVISITKFDDDTEQTVRARVTAEIKRRMGLT